MKSLLLFINYSIIIFLTSFSPSYAQQLSPNKLQTYNDLAVKIVRSALIDRKGYEWLKELCDIGPRLSGSEKSLKAIYWAEKKMRSCGFDSVWLQPVMVPKWERGRIEKAIISRSKKYLNKKLTIVSLGGSIGTAKVGITSEVIEVKSLDQVKTLGDKAKGKIIFTTVPLITDYSVHLRDTVRQLINELMELSKRLKLGLLV